MNRSILEVKPDTDMSRCMPAARSMVQSKGNFIPLRVIARDSTRKMTRLM